MQNGTKIFVIVLASVAVGGLLVYVLKKQKPAAVAPPMKVSGWSNGNANFSIGPNSGQLNAAGNNGAGTLTQSNPGSYYLDNGGWDGTGWNFNVLQGGPQGALLNTLYVTGNGSWT